MTIVSARVEDGCPRFSINLGSAAEPTESIIPFTSPLFYVLVYSEAITNYVRIQILIKEKLSMSPRRENALVSREVVVENGLVGRSYVVTNRQYRRTQLERQKATGYRTAF